MARHSKYPIFNADDTVELRLVCIRYAVLSDVSTSASNTAWNLTQIPVWRAVRRPHQLIVSVFS